jgi:hypothetical protein
MYLRRAAISIMGLSGRVYGSFDSPDEQYAIIRSFSHWSHRDVLTDVPG